MSTRKADLLMCMIASFAAGAAIGRTLTPYSSAAAIYVSFVRSSRCCDEPDLCGICAAQEDLRQFVEKKADQPFKCPVCDEQVIERIDVRKDGLNDHNGYRERLSIVNAVLTRVLSDACKNCYMISPVSYPLILNPADVDRYLSTHEDELKLTVVRSLCAVLEDNH